MKAQVILNPYAGRWMALKRLPEVHTALQAAGFEYNLVQSEAPRHAIELAARAVQDGAEVIIAAGGDGTISEVMNGICQASGVAAGGKISVSMGVLPLGTANDFVINLGLPKTLADAAAALPASTARVIDLGQISYGEARQVCFFDNNSAIGLEPTVTLIQQEIKWMQGTPRYLLATLIAIARHPQWTARVEWDGGDYEGPISLVTVGNNPLTGGLFYMTPHADPADGKLTFVYGYMRTRLQVLGLLPRTMKPGAGSYVEHPSIHEVHATWLRIHTQQPTPLHADGEIQSQDVHDMEYQVLPGRLPVLVPVKAV